jgi:hypothetical protein
MDDGNADSPLQPKMRLLNQFFLLVNPAGKGNSSVGDYQPGKGGKNGEKS